MNTVLVTDFDGTITKIDFFHRVIDELLAKDDITPWHEYEAGRITHFDALNLIFRKIKLSVSELNEFILELPVEEDFSDTVAYCQKAGIPVYIVSAGADYYIKYILNRLKLGDSIEIIANRSAYSPAKGLQMFRLAEDSPFYSYNYGVDKENVVKYLKNTHDRVIFAGDGTPDFYAAKHADIVFARGQLLKLCRDNGVQAGELNSYRVVKDCLASL